MIKKIFYLLIALFLFSCEEEGEFTKQEAQEQVIIDPNVELIELYNGTFAPTSGINVTGQAKVFQQGTTRYVSLENFTISDGPDLKVYLSTTANPDMFVNLGNLTSATNYSIPSEVDLVLYKYVLIHCQQYNHLFAIANLN